MRNKIINLYNENQKLNIFKKNQKLLNYFLKKKIGKYTQTNVLAFQTTRYVSLCQIQGKYKKTLNIYKFNRHIVRSSTLKQNFSSLSYNNW